MLEGLPKKMAPGVDPGYESRGGFGGMPSTVGRGKGFSGISGSDSPKEWHDEGVHLFQGDSLDFYQSWPSPQTIVSDGAYGILGFHGDPAQFKELPRWYEPHVQAWSQKASPQTTLWFWNSEMGWASVHPILEKHGWSYVSCNTWDKGKGHMAGNVNTNTIRRFPVVSEVCVQYVWEAKINGLTIKDWLRAEWQRTGLPFRKANEACGVKDAASRKYFDRGHLWYPPPRAPFEKLVAFANRHGAPEGCPYFSRDGQVPLTGAEWQATRSLFQCPHGVTNIWQRSPLRGQERLKVPAGKKPAHLNQKPLDLMRMIIEASTVKGGVVWEPFGGLFTGSLAAKGLDRLAYGAEIDPDYFHLGVKRF